jgi:hypothetical protein
MLGRGKQELLGQSHLNPDHCCSGCMHSSCIDLMLAGHALTYVCDACRALAKALEASSNREQSLDKHVAELQHLCAPSKNSHGAPPLEVYEAALRTVDNLRRELVPRAQELDMLKSSHMVCLQGSSSAQPVHRNPRNAAASECCMQVSAPCHHLSCVRHTPAT